MTDLTEFIAGTKAKASEVNSNLSIVHQELRVTVEAGENISDEDAVYIHLTDGKAYISGTGAQNDIRVDGMAENTATSGQDVSILKLGVHVTTGLTDKQDYYLGAAGAISTTLSGVRIGTALSTTELLVDIRQDDRDAVGTIKAYHNNITGLPSNNLNAFWALMDGTTISDVESPLNGQTLTDLNGTPRFLRGADTSGSTGGADTHTHQSGGSRMSGNGFTTTGGFQNDGGNVSKGMTAQNNIPAYMGVAWIIKIK